MCLPLFCGLAVLTASCELVAGIDDIELTDASTDGGRATGDTSDAASAEGADATAAEAAAPAPSVESGTAEASADTGAADAAGDASMGDAAAPSDGGTDTTVVPVTGDASTSPADTGSEASPLVGPDGGPVVLELIDDMEGTTPTPGWLDGPYVNGTWFTFDDGSDGGVLTPVPGGTSAAPIIALLEAPHTTYNGISSLHAARVTANNGFTIYGDGLGFNVHIVNSSTPETFDASKYQGVVFWARALGSGGAPGTRFNVMDINTAPPGSGGICDGGVCNGYFGFDFGKNGVPALTAAWQRYTIYFADLARPVWAMSDPGLVFDPTQIIGCQVQLAESVAGDLWIDDIYFIK